MELREFFSEEAVQLELQGTSKDEVLKELIGLLGLDEKAEGMLFKMLKRRENLGSTGIGRGIAIAWRSGASATVWTSRPLTTSRSTSSS
jgi:mannitol/fructose-specific phosphotransferase system IIA component (Ntr-type)